MEEIFENSPGQQGRRRRSIRLQLKQNDRIQSEAVNLDGSLKKKEPTKRSSKNSPLPPEQAENFDEEKEKNKTLVKRRRSEPIRDMEEKPEIKRGRRSSGDLLVCQRRGLPVVKRTVPGNLTRSTPSRGCVSKIKKRDWNIDRILCKIGERYLVSWSGWNFTWSSTVTWSDLQKSPLHRKDFLEYEKGIQAIYDNVINTEWYSENVAKKGQTLFERRFLHELKPIEDDAELKRLLNGPQQELKAALGDLKYWKVKRVELQWLQAVLNYKLPLPQLYLESMLSQEKLPEIEFIIEYQLTEKAKKLTKNGKGTHYCVFGPPEEYCDECKSMVRLEQNDPKNLNDLTFPDNFSVEEGAFAYMVVCTATANCVCPGGWKKCSKWLPRYPREVPLVIFADPRYYGWGVRALVDIRKGTIVSEYCGQVSTVSEAQATDTSYQMGTYGDEFIIDAKHYGNESRFFGHACSNVNLLLVRIFCRDVSMEYQFRYVFVAVRDIKAGEDLVFDYHPESDRPKRGYGRCRCGTEKCRGWL